MLIPSRQRHIPTLDGWRGIAILMVLLDHGQLAFAHRNKYPWLHLGQHGVTVFFVLSGYLITSRLLLAPIDLPRFYLRRVRRLLPTAATYLVVALLLSVVTHQILVRPVELLGSLFSFRNYVDNAGAASLTIHFWSLSVEEQFYVFWPLMLRFFGARHSIWVSVLIAALCAFVRWQCWSSYSGQYAGYHLEARLDAPLLGCCTALLLRDPRIRSAIARFSSPLFIASLAVFGLYMRSFHELIPFGESCAIAFLIAVSVTSAGKGVTRPLTWGPLEFTGRISYSLYVWQILFFVLWDPLAAVIAIPVFGLISYYFLEQPKLRDKGVRASAPTPASSC